jgi:hypothetical protein
MESESFKRWFTTSTRRIADHYRSLFTDVQKKEPANGPAFLVLVEVAGVEPASESVQCLDLHA